MRRSTPHTLARAPRVMRLRAARSSHAFSLCESCRRLPSPTSRSGGRKTILPHFAKAADAALVGLASQLPVPHVGWVFPGQRGGAAARCASHLLNGMSLPALLILSVAPGSSPRRARPSRSGSVFFPTPCRCRWLGLLSGAARSCRLCHWPGWPAAWRHVLSRVPVATGRDGATARRAHLFCRHRCAACSSHLCRCRRWPVAQR